MPDINILLLCLLFLAAAVISAFAATRLSNHADTISKKSKINGFLAGTVLLAVATSLPELTATVSASLIDNADIAVGNGLGSILFNLFVLYLLDLVFRKRKIFLNTSRSHIYTGSVALVLCIISAAALFTPHSFTFLGISLPSYLILIAYLSGMWIVSKKEQGTAEDPQETKDESLKKAFLWFAVYAVLIFIAGSTLSLTGDAISAATGLSASAVGSILVAFATSVPDAFSVYAALRLGNGNMAVGTILGSNIFNVMILAIGDAFYRGGSIFQDAGNSLLYLAALGFALTAVTIVVILRKEAKNLFSYSLPSLLVIISYLTVLSFILFV